MSERKKQNRYLCLIMQQNKAAKIISINVIFVVGSPGSAKQSRSTKWFNQFPVLSKCHNGLLCCGRIKGLKWGKTWNRNRLPTPVSHGQHLSQETCQTCAINNHFLKIILFDDQCLEFYQWHDVSFAPGRKRRRSEHRWSCWRPLYSYPWAIRARTAYSSWHASW